MRKLFTFALVAFAGALAIAGKPGGGGGDTGGGTVYFTNHDDGGRAWSMSSDGTGKAALPAGVSGEPSRDLHGGQRWFVQQQPVAGKSELFAVRGDGNAAFTTQLTNQADLEVLGSARWMPGDAGVSWIARRLDLSGVVEGGIYSASIVFDAGGNVTGLAAQPVAPAVTVALVLDNGTMKPNVAFHDWAPDGLQVVHDRLKAPAEIWIADLSGSTRLLVEGFGWPVWSPDGSKIAYSRYGSIWTVSPDGSGAKQVIGAGAWQNVGAPMWSPTGSHLLYFSYSTRVFVPVTDIYRTTAAGGSKTNLTGDVTDSGSHLGWR